MVRFSSGRVGLTCKKHMSSQKSTRFYFESKKLDSYQVFFWSGQVRKILTHLAMSSFLTKKYNPMWRSIKMREVCFIKEYIYYLLFKASYIASLIMVSRSRCCFGLDWSPQNHLFKLLIQWLLNCYPLNISKNRGISFVIL